MAVNGMLFGIAVDNTAHTCRHLQRLVDRDQHDLDGIVLAFARVELSWDLPAAITAPLSGEQLMKSARLSLSWYTALAVALLAIGLTGCENASQAGSVEAREQIQKTASLSAPIRDGKVVYELECAPCHQTGLEGAPALDSAPDWVARTPEWTAVLKDHASKGFRAMPPKGASPDLPDAEVEAAVDYMVGQIMPPSILAPGAARGRLVYQTTCKDCHNTGVDGAPIIGDRDAWLARSPNFHTILDAHANKGFLRMPAKGQQLQLFSEDIEAAVDFMMAWIRR